MPGRRPSIVPDYANEPTGLTAQHRREIADGRAFITLSKSNPTWLIAQVAGVSEAEVKRLMNVASKAAK